MNYIIKHDFNEQMVPYYVRLVDDKTFDEIYDPTSATQFNTKKEAQKWIDTYSSMAKYSKVVETADAIQEYEKWVKSGSIRRTLARVNTSMSRPYNDEPLDEVHKQLIICY
jgi:replicative DNA helicase